MGSFTKLNYHLVFSTKYRRDAITVNVQERLYEYLGGLVRKRDGVMLAVGGIENHIHVLAGLAAKHSVSDILREIKANSSSWINETFSPSLKFEWQKGYAAFTVSYSGVNEVRRYVDNQKEHHRELTFQEEYIAMLEKHDISYDPKYLFEGEHHS